MHSQSSPSTPSELPIAVIGDGFSATMTAIQLARRLPGNRVILFSASGPKSHLASFQNADDSVRLNIPAGRMSAFADQPDHFLNYARQAYQDDVKSGDFLPRRVFAEYLKACFSEAASNCPLLLTDSRAVVDLTGWDDRSSSRLVFKDQSTLDVALAVLATGNHGSAFAASIWAPHTRPATDPTALAAVEDGQDVLVVGSGLPMFDAVLELDRLGKAGTIHAVSRNALLPRPYAKSKSTDVPDLDHLPDSNLPQSLRLFRQALRAHEAKGGNWRDIFAAIRPSIPSLWQELSARDRSRFVRLLSPFWEVHRHQCSPENFARISILIGAGKLVLHKGTIVSVEQGGAHKRMGLAARSRDEATRWLEADHIFDATGPARDITTISHPLIQNLLRRGFLTADAHRLGAETGPDYHAIGRGGQASAWLYVVGPMLRGRYFEANAVHELRLHTAALAKRIATSLHANTEELVSAE